MKRIFLLLLISVLVLLIPFSAYAAANVPAKILGLRPSVVRVVCDLGDGAYAEGTGFAVGTIEPVQYIATNYHVIDGNKSITVWYGKEIFINAAPLAELPASDICILKLEKPIFDIKPMVIDDRDDAQTGDGVYALGFPGGADEFTNERSATPDQVTVTDGIISSIKSYSILEGRSPVMLYQINVAINHGNSGGPLVNEKGEVIGVNTLGASEAQDINAAISIQELTGLLKQNGIPYRTGNFFAENIWLLIAFAAAAAAAILFILIKKGKVRFFVKKRSKNIPLEKFLVNMGGRLPFDMAAKILEPVIRRLAEMHAKGMCHLDICPENITIDPALQSAELLEPGKKDAGGYTILTRPGYSPLEQYRAGGDIGTWTDVYAVGAVIYRMVTGKNPPEALARMENDSELSGNIIDHLIDFNKKQAWLRALNISAEGRTRNCGRVAEELLGPVPLYTVTYSGDDTAVTENQGKKAKCRKRKWIPISIVCTFAVAAAGYFGWAEYNYRKLVGYVENEYFTQATEIVPKMPVFYKDMEKLQNYNYAGVQMEQGNYGVARQWFGDLGDFKEAKEMLKEVDYQEAFTILDSGNYDRARKAFQNLGNYKDAADMIKECDYQKAIDAFNDEDYLYAYSQFSEIQGYADVNDIMTVLIDIIYNKGVELYRSEDSLAINYFNVLDGYLDSSAYIKLYNYRNSYYPTEQDYQDLLSYIGFEDALDILMNDEFIYLYLKGDWSDGNGYYFWLKEMNSGQWQWHSNYNLPWYAGEHFDIIERVYKIDGKDQFKFSFVSPNEMSVYCYKNHRTYEMYRE